jgi:hypothetical protein
MGWWNMKQLLMATALVVLGACGDRSTGVSVSGSAFVEITPAPIDTELIVEATNDDPADYALWLQWQEDNGSWNQTFLFSVFSDPLIGPTRDFADLFVSPGTYYVVLADPDGNLVDSQAVWLPVGGFLDVHYRIVNGFLLRTS